MNLTEIVSSSFARVAALVAAVTATTALVTFTIAYVVFATTSDTQLRQLVNTDAAGLAELFAAEGLSGLAGRIDDRLALRPVSGEEPVYALADNNERMLAGNLDAWVEGAPLDATWVRREMVLGDRTVPVLGRALLMPGDVRLFVGRTTTEQEAALAQLRLMYGLGFIASLILGSLGGFVAAWLVRRKVGELNTALQAVRDGAIDRRAPGDDAGDEFGMLARNINDMLERIERLITAQREVNDLTAHELKAPLVRIDHTLAKQNRDDPDVARARDQIAGLTELIEQLMDISAVSAQIGDKRGLEDLDLAAIVRQLAGLYEDVAEEAGVTLTIEAGEPFPLRGNAVQLTRAVSNLIDNAIKFSPKGGTVRVATLPGPRLEVSDSGPGVPVEERERIFTRFVRSASVGGVKGHGLGLSFVHAAARRHGLIISVEDAQLGAASPGARFVLRPDDAR